MSTRATASGFRPTLAPASPARGRSHARATRGRTRRTTSTASIRPSAVDALRGPAVPAAGGAGGATAARRGARRRDRNTYTAAWDTLHIDASRTRWARSDRRHTPRAPCRRGPSQGTGWAAAWDREGTLPILRGEPGAGKQRAAMPRQRQRRRRRCPPRGAVGGLTHTGGCTVNLPPSVPRAASSLINSPSPSPPHQP